MRDRIWTQFGPGDPLGSAHDGRMLLGAHLGSSSAPAAGASFDQPEFLNGKHGRCAVSVTELQNFL